MSIGKEEKKVMDELWDFLTFKDWEDEGFPTINSEKKQSIRRGKPISEMS